VQTPLRPRRTPAHASRALFTGSFLLWVGLPPGLAGQAGPVGEGLVGGVVGGSAGVGVLQDAPVLVLHGRGLLQVTPRLRLGAEGVRIPTAARTSPPGSPDRSELVVGYGGIRGEWRPSPDSPWSAGLLLAAATARVRSPLLPSDLASRNFPLLEPGVSRRLSRVGPLQGGVTLSARLPLGGPALPGVQPGALRGATLSLSAEWVRDP
jgi:hypothetical protein